MPNIIIEGEGDVYLTPYKSYVALLTQNATGNPTAIVLNANDSNYLGNIVWTRSDVAYYIGTLAGVFTENKTFFIMGQSDATQVGTAYTNRIDVNQVYVDTTDGSGAYSDSVLNNTSLEIRVYP